MGKGRVRPRWRLGEGVGRRLYFRFSLMMKLGPMRHRGIVRITWPTVFAAARFGACLIFELARNFRRKRLPCTPAGTRIREIWHSRTAKSFQPNEDAGGRDSCLLGLSATNQYYFSFGTNQPTVFVNMCVPFGERIESHGKSG
jgi:hypothetical protein